jgi:predicted type IV restriction endonuclease
MVTGLKRFQIILSAAKSRDAGEADTSTIVKDMLSELFGYDKYTEITSEYMIKGTYCDLAVKLEGKLALLIEVKAIGLDLKDGHVKQAVDYGANQGIEWVILTNGAIWRIYRIFFCQPISTEIVYECDLLSTNAKNRSQVENLFLFAKEGQNKSVLQDFHAQRQAKSRYVLAAIVLSEAVIDVARRELRRVFPDIKVGSDELRSELMLEVLKREVTEGEKADEARKRISKAQGRPLKARAKAVAGSNGEEENEEETPEESSEAREAHP